MSAISSAGRMAGSVAGVCLLPDQRHDLVERTGHGTDRAGRHPRIECGVVELGVSKQNLDHADVDAILEQMRGEAMAQRVRAHPLGNTGGLCSLFDDAPELAGGDRLAYGLARKQPTGRAHYPPLAAV